MFLHPFKDEERMAVIDVSGAFLQSHAFPEHERHYLKFKDPVSKDWRYFRQLVPVYGQNSAPVRWLQTLFPFLVDTLGFVQGKNDPCIFYHPDRQVRLLCYVDDVAIRSANEKGEKWFEFNLNKRFECKETVHFVENRPLDHLGIVFFRSNGIIYASMAHYIDAMILKLGLEDRNCRKYNSPMVGPITDLTELSTQEIKRYMMKIRRPLVDHRLHDILHYRQVRVTV